MITIEVYIDNYKIVNGELISIIPEEPDYTIYIQNQIVIVYNLHHIEVEVDPKSKEYYFNNDGWINLIESKWNQVERIINYKGESRLITRHYKKYEFPIREFLNKLILDIVSKKYEMHKKSANDIKIFVNRSIEKGCEFTLV
jgi:hypothetical protein